MRDRGSGRPTDAADTLCRERYRNCDANSLSPLGEKGATSRKTLFYVFFVLLYTIL